jgi:hypothetical protein
MLGFIQKTVIRVQRSIHSEVSLHVFSSSEAGIRCVWSPFHDVRVEKVERVQRRFIRYALRSFGWADIYNLPPYEHRYALLRLDTLVKRRSIACIMFIFNVMGGRMNSPSLLSALDLKTPHDIELRIPSFFELDSIARTTGFMNRCLPQCASLTKSLVCSISF